MQLEKACPVYARQGQEPVGVELIRQRHAWPTHQRMGFVVVGEPEGVAEIVGDHVTLDHVVGAI